MSKSWTVAELAGLIEEEFSGDGGVEITRVADIKKAGAGAIAFLEKAEKFAGTNAACLIAPPNFDQAVSFPVIKSDKPKRGFARIAALLHPAKKREPEIHSSAIIAADARIGDSVFIGAFCCVGEGSGIGSGTQLRSGAKVGDGVAIGQNCVIHPNVFIEDGCVIGSNVILHTGVVIGADGFGYVRDQDRHIKFPQIGTVVIEDEVEIGANTCIDRGALGETRIGAGTKIDNLCQIAHNVEIGKRVIIAAMTGISGSAVIEDDVVLAGQVGIADHARICAGAVIGAKSAVFPGKIVRAGAWAGIPVQPMEEYKKQRAFLKNLKSKRD
jgi:UDP-3-O-[3-hydroxymyristoyl] glucosamine N-acyltransferase